MQRSSSPWMRPFLKGAALLIALSCLGAPVANGGDWYVLCDTTSGEVVARSSQEGAGLVTLAGPLPGTRTAMKWVEESCPGRRCGADGRCLGKTPASAEARSAGGWVVGELRTVSAPTSSADSTSTATGAQARPNGPPSSNLGPLVEYATAAAAACNYVAALAGADHMANFDPQHPWLAANHDKLRTLAERQRATEQAAWQASSALEAGKLKRARDLAAAAAETAVSCQDEAVVQLLDGIETALVQERQLRAAKHQQAAAALIPGLLDLARVVSGGQSLGSTPGVVVGSAGVATARPQGTTDPCAFKYEYRNQWSFEPVCTCAGYSFDPARYCCVHVGG